LGAGSYPFLGTGSGAAAATGTASWAETIQLASRWGFCRGDLHRRAGARSPAASPPPNAVKGADSGKLRWQRPTPRTEGCGGGDA